MKETRPIRLVALDLDGTLLNEKFELTNEVRASIQRAQDAGLQIAIATGRDRRSAEPFLRELGTDRFAITSGGALLRIDAHIIAQNSFTLPQITNILKLGLEYGTGFFVDQPEQTWRFGNQVYTDMYAHVSNSIPNDQVESMLNPSPIKVSLVQERGVLNKLREQLESQHPELNMAFPFEHILDINPSGTNKGSALTRLAEVLGIHMHEVAAVGDSENDVSMFMVAGFSFAMGNSPKHVQQSANYIAPRNDQNGVVNVIDSIISFNDMKEKRIVILS